MSRPLAETVSHRSDSTRSRPNYSAGVFIRLADQPGYKSKIRHSDAEYFRLSEKEARIAKAPREQSVPTLEQIRRVLSVMPTTTDIEKRNRAVFAFTLLTGVRDDAMASVKLKHVDLREGKVLQDARQVRTKFAKTFTTWFFPVGDDVRSIVEEWVRYLKEQKLWSNDDPLFPSTAVVNGRNCQFEARGLSRNHWANAGPIRKIFRDAFSLAGLPYFNPHSFRNTLVQLGQRLCRTPEEMKAWSQNIGHEHVLTTLCSYGAVASTRQAEIIRSLGEPSDIEMNLHEALATLQKHVKRSG